MRHSWRRAVVLPRVLSSNDAGAAGRFCSSRDVLSRNRGIRLLFDSDQQRHLQPLLIAIDVGEADVAQPAKLCLDVE